MSIHDFFIHAIYDWGPGLIIVLICVGAMMLWRRTRRVTALVQLLATILMLIAWALFELRIQTTGEFETTTYSLFLRAPWLRFAVDVSMWVGVFAFSIAYTCYSVTIDRHLQRSRRI